jgi:phosphatidylglycerophosphate synthase
MAVRTELREQLTARVRGHAGVSLYGRQVNRRLGGVVARVAFRWGLRPNQVTAASGLVSALAVALLILVRPTALSGPLVWFLVAFAYVLDSADGQLARLRGGGTPAGEWFDHVVDAGRVVALHGGVAIMAYRFYESQTAPLVALLYAFASSVLFAAGTLAEILLRGHGGDAPDAPAVAPAITLRGLLLMPLDLGVLGFSFVFVAYESAFLTVYGIFLALTVVIGAALIAKWFRKLSAVPAT